MTRTCPVCDSPHDTWGGVATHAWKKSDDEHSHVNSKDGGLEWLAREGHMGADVSPESDPNEEPESDTSESDTLNPTFGSGPPEVERDEIDLPCGHESFDADDAPEPPFTVRCSQCGDEREVTQL